VEWRDLQDKPVPLPDLVDVMEPLDHLDLLDIKDLLVIQVLWDLLDLPDPQVSPPHQDHLLHALQCVLTPVSELAHNHVVMDVRNFNPK
jgi:hypothetical protein